MNKFLWLTIPSILIFSQAVLATTVDCALQPRLNISRSTNNITAFPYSQNIVDATQYPVTSGGGCRPIAAARFDFRVNSSNTDLEGSKPFGVKSTVNVIGSTANATTLDAAKNWLASNLKLSFRFQSKDDAVDILNQNTAYNIFPSNTANGGTGGITTINGERYSTGNGSSGVTTMSVNLFSLAVQLNVQPSSSIIDALNGKTIEIHAGTLTVKYDNWALGGNPPPTGVTATKTVEVYLNLKLNFRGFPTCTMENQTVNLAQVPTAFLNSNQTANEQSFNV
ncbi:fimbrial protein, partial [Acinetobacter sp. Root1280]|uniref:fimbrial protein n=1 Tax=Acinetobacter sp. Root1280 TaxID=1736444 RepID=UPI001D0D134B